MVINWHTFHSRKDGRLSVHQAWIYRGNLIYDEDNRENEKRKQWLLKYFSFPISLPVISHFFIYNTLHSSFTLFRLFSYFIYFLFPFFCHFPRTSRNICKGTTKVSWSKPRYVKERYTRKKCYIVLQNKRS